MMMARMSGHLVIMVMVTSLRLARAGLLGAGTGEGSCAAPPFRAYEVQWSYGCPAFAPCCSEFGFCRPLSEWEYGEFRDCNGVSNGTPLPPEVIAAEEAAGGSYAGGKPAGEVGPPPEVIKASHAAHGELPHAVAPHHAAHHAVAAPHHAAHHAVAAPHHAAHHAVVAPHHAAPAPHHAAHLAAVDPHHALAAPHHAAHALAGPHHAPVLAPHAAVTPHHAAHGPIIGPHPAPVVPHPAVHHDPGLPHLAAHHAAVAPLHAAHPVHTAHAPVAPISPLHHTVHQAPVHAVHSAPVHGLSHAAHAVHGPVHAVHGPAHAVHSAPHHAVHSAPHHAVHSPSIAPVSHPVHALAPLPVHQPAVAAPLLAHPVGPVLHHSGHGLPAPSVHHAVHHPSIGPLQQVLHGAHHTDTQSAQLRAAPQPAFVAFGSESAAPVSVVTTPASVVTSPAPASPVTIGQQEAVRSAGQAASRPGPPVSPEPAVTPAPSLPILSSSSPLVTTPAPRLVTTLASEPPRSQPVSASRQPKLISAAAPSLQNLQQSAAVHSQAATQPRVLQSVVNNLATSPTSAAGPATSPRLGNPALASGPGSRGVGVAPQLPAPSSLPIPVSGDDSRCLHPKGSGSYTCLSFGAPHKPIFAFHTVQDEDGVVFGTGSGFPDQNQDPILSQAETGVNGVRKIRKVLVSKDFIQKEFGRLKLFDEEMRRERARSYDFNSPKRKRMVTYPTLNGLPLTAYQEKLLRDSELESKFSNYNPESSPNTLDNEVENIQIYEYPL